MSYEFVKIGNPAHTWNDLSNDWQRQTQKMGHSFDPATQLEEDVLKPLVERNSQKAGVYALRSEDGYHAICQVNTAGIPGYKKPVMRVRFLTFAPAIDLGERSIDDYIEVLVEIFFSVINLCIIEGPMKAGHTHFHLPSPNDRQFFAAVGRNVAEQKKFAEIASKGAWLYIKH